MRKVRITRIFEFTQEPDESDDRFNEIIGDFKMGEDSSRGVHISEGLVENTVEEITE